MKISFSFSKFNMKKGIDTERVRNALLLSKENNLVSAKITLKKSIITL
jgi:hypothetical protein